MHRKSLGTIYRFPRGNLAFLAVTPWVLEDLTPWGHPFDFSSTHFGDFLALGVVQVKHVWGLGVEKNGGHLGAMFV